MAFEATFGAHAPEIRLAVFLAMLAAMGLWEIAAPLRALAQPRARRWRANLALAAINAIILGALFPAASVGMAQFAHERGWGYFNIAGWPYPVAVLATVVALDFVVYLQHVLFHAVPALWRLHRVHHADLDFDVTTGVRFHPIEMVLSLLIKFAAIAALGAPVAAVLLFELVLNAMAMFNHSNVRMPAVVERALRWLVVTPDMHRVHHSVERAETDSNFGFNLSAWDRLLGTYRAQPGKGHADMVIGLAQVREPGVCARLRGMLALPFRRAASPSPEDAARLGPSVAPN